MTAKRSLVISCVSVITSIFADAEHTFTRWESLSPLPEQPQRAAFLPLQSQLSLELRSALDKALGVGHGVQEGYMLEVLAELGPTWKSLPKDTSGHVDHRSLYHIVHRHFTQRYSLSILGLQPNAVNSSKLKAKRTVLEGEAALYGFSIEDAVAMVILLEHILADSSLELLEKIFRRYKVKSELSFGELSPLLTNYLLRWLVPDEISVRRAEKDPSYASKMFENWDEMASLLPGSLKTFAHFSANGAYRARGKSPSQGGAWNPFHQRFSFDEAQLATSSLTSSLGSFWKTECAMVKEKLLGLDSTSTGRVRLSKFHGSALSGEWRFSESKEYLQKLGALDDSSSWHGPQVIIPNYLQSASNCIVTDPYYHICCPNECEAHLDALESAVGGPTAEPKMLLELVKALVAENSDDGARLPASMRSQLMAIASTHNGRVPLHGRLFAQWLHYAFPNECPFPHLSGTTHSFTPHQFGRKAQASIQEMRRHEASENRTREASLAGEERMTMWSHEEELLSERLHLTAPWETNVFHVLKLLLGAALALCGVLGVRSRFSESDVKAALPWGLSPEGKCHFV
eukprot:CAMPEP_0170645174 /NCGR_PEP_ID=MMETSP0224-20130122/42920_1 /TAXON_ID=285029 /ORGANISM="Togula jolla, Strain CCCM 725" /LENGTH=572 /DNA_ID=CAMNT_0010976335 /DNA_START=110 /DNA_END=1829 /DNA_ORIENTATION=+